MGCSKEFKDAVLKYKYSSPTLSILEKLYLNNFWTQVAEFYPRWLAPNLITLMGYGCVWLAFLITLEGSPSLNGELESWKYFLNAFLYFAYQTLDGSDGKQARRTGSGSALGELMDHGVDAVVTSLLALLVSDALKFNILSIWPWSFCLVALLSFFLSNMTLVHSGRQMFFDMDVMEVQTVMIISLIIAGWMGTGFFDTISFPVPSFLSGFKTDIFGLLKPGEMIDFSNGMSLKHFISLGGLFGCFANYPQYLLASAKPYLFLSEADKPQHVKDKVTGTGLGSLLFHLVLIHSFIGIGVCCVINGIKIEDTARAESAMRAFGVIIAFSFGDLMDRVLLMRVAREPLPWLPLGFIPMVGFLVCSIVDDKMTDASWWWILALLSFVIHHSYFIRSVGKLAEALGIHPFKIKKVNQQ